MNNEVLTKTLIESIDSREINRRKFALHLCAHVLGGQPSDHAEMVDRALATADAESGNRRYNSQHT